MSITTLMIGAMALGKACLRMMSNGRQALQLRRLDIGRLHDVEDRGARHAHHVGEHHQRQRGDPAILLADEPTGNLDSTNGEAVMELLRELHQGGSTICMVTHDARYARHADRSVHLFDGKVVEERQLTAVS